MFDESYCAGMALGPAIRYALSRWQGLTRFIDGEQLGPCPKRREKALVQRAQMEGRMPHPVRERRPVEMDALAGIDLGLPVERQMIGIFRHQNLGDGCLGRQSALDQPGWSLGLPDAVFACAAGVFGTPGDDDTELGRDQVQPFAPVLADLVQVAPTAWTGLVDVDHDLDPRQMDRQCSAIATALACALHPTFRDYLVLARFRAGRDLLDILEAQQHLLLGKRLGLPAKAMALHLLDDLTQPLALMPLGQQHRLQRLEIIRKVIARHPQIRSYSAPFYDDPHTPDSLRRSAANNYPACVGATVSRASWTSRQSRPSSRADNCPDAAHMEPVGG
jgi:hypothetical protein